MKIQCDVCNKNEASVFCSADEAALCDECDQGVHFANKLASKHQRFSLVQPSSSRFPICDICQEKRALLFCQQDRAILCRDCDIPLHTANEYTQKHNRFLLTGAQLSATISDKRKAAAVTVTDSRSDNAVPDFKSLKKPTSVMSELLCCKTASSVLNNSSSNSKSTNRAGNSVNDHQLISGGSTASNISDYLIDTLPGWHFDDFILDPPPAASTTAPFGFSKGGNTNYWGAQEEMFSFFNVENEKNMTAYNSAHQAENIWVPQAPAPAATSIAFGQPSMFGTKQQQETNVNINKLHRKNIKKDDAFTVPQLSASFGSKRNRSFW